MPAGPLAEHRRAGCRRCCPCTRGSATTCWPRTRGLAPDRRAGAGPAADVAAHAGPARRPGAPRQDRRRRADDQRGAHRLAGRRAQRTGADRAAGRAGRRLPGLHRAGASAPPAPSSSTASRCRSLAAVVRRAPRPGPGEVVLPLAALAAAVARRRPPARRRGGRCTAYGGDPVAFLRRPGRVLLPPLLTAAAPRRRAGGARAEHAGRAARRPAGADRSTATSAGCGSARRGCARPGVDAPPLHGDLPTDDPDVLRTKLAAAASAVALAELVAVLARDARRRARTGCGRPSAAAVSAAPAPPDARPRPAARDAAAGQGDHGDAAGRRPARRPVGHAAPTRWRRAMTPQPDRRRRPRRRHAEADLAVHAPELVRRLPRRAAARRPTTVGRRLLGALCREDIGDSRARYAADGQRHALRPGRVRRAPASATRRSCCDGPLAGAGAGLRRRAARRRGQPRHRAAPAPARPAAERRRRRRTSAALGAGTARGRRAQPAPVRAYPARLGHRRRARPRPGGRQTRDRVRRRPRRPAHRRRPRRRARPAYPELPAPPTATRLQPVHAWQLRHRAAAPVRATWSPTARCGSLDARRCRPRPTAALRTLLLPPAPTAAPLPEAVAGHPGHLDPAHHLAWPAPATARPSPRCCTGCSPTTRPAQRVLLLAETAGAAVPAGTGRDLSAIVRDGLAGRLRPGEVAVPGGGAVRAGRAGRAGRPVRGQPWPRRPARAPRWPSSRDYARLLLPPVLRLAARYGIGLEAHLQNCLPTFVGGVPHRLVLRDFAGLRLHLPRLAAAGHRLALWPGSVVGTDDPAVMRAKVGYTALQAHLGELVVRLVASHGLDETAGLAGGARGRRRGVRAAAAPRPGHRRQAAADHAVLTARYVPHKALVRMRLAGDRRRVPAGAATRCMRRLSRSSPPLRARSPARSAPTSTTRRRCGTRAAAAAGGAAGRAPRCCTR